MAKSDNLRKAKEAKDDEFYTRISDIEKEVKNYKSQFEGKTVFCNCDDPFESNFFKYFAMNFNALKLKKLIVTCYATSPITGEQLSLFDLNYDVKAPSAKHPYKIIINSVEDINKDGAFNMADIEMLVRTKENTLALLKGDGDFRSPECIKLLKESDIICTNPPFSLWREYIAQIMEYNKQFLIIGNINNVNYKEIFPLVKANKIWFGYNTVKEFDRPDGSVQKFGNVCWYTNLDVKKRHEKIDLYKKYNPEEYPSYDNFNGIDVSSVAEIPVDYYGYMGVPGSFLDKYNPEQFRIIGIGTGDTAKTIGITKNHRGRTDLAYTINGIHKCPFNRIIIQRIDTETKDGVE